MSADAIEKGKLFANFCLDIAKYVGQTGEQACQTGEQAFFLGVNSGTLATDDRKTEDGVDEIGNSVGSDSFSKRFVEEEKETLVAFEDQVELRGSRSVRTPPNEPAYEILYFCSESTELDDGKTPRRIRRRQRVKSTKLEAYAENHGIEVDLKEHKRILAEKRLRSKSPRKRGKSATKNTKSAERNRSKSPKKKVNDSPVHTGRKAAGLERKGNRGRSPMKRKNCNKNDNSGHQRVVGKSAGRRRERHTSPKKNETRSDSPIVPTSKSPLCNCKQQETFGTRETEVTISPKLSHPPETIQFTNPDLLLGTALSASSTDVEARDDNPSRGPQEFPSLY